MNVQMLPAMLIGNPAPIRTVHKKRAKEIADSIREIGLLSPLIVKPGMRFRNGSQVPGWDILAGNHRFEALFRILNWTEVPCIVTDADGLKAELLTIDENLVRRELSDAERAYQTARRKEIYQALHPETKGGGTTGGRSGRTKNGVAKLAKPNGEAADRFTASTAQATGRSERSVQREAERGEKLGATLNRIAGTSLDKGVEIDALAALPPAEREDIVSRAEKGERVSARKPTEAPAAAPANVIPLEADERHATTIARKLMREYQQAPIKARHLFDELYALERDGPEFAERVG